ncbi:porin family protein [Chitinophaga sp. MM2321]|uniref:porin family protein n=1 Tax=Chitinophaga sp. MM2321 TaxID=3137178 RepID=UPI0032D56D1A
MKFFTLVCVVSFFIGPLVNAQVSLGVRGGYINSGLDLHQSANSSPKLKASNVDKWQAGLYLSIPLFKQGYLQPGLSFITKGTELAYVSPLPANVFLPRATQINLQYLELPVNFIYKIPVGFGKVFVGAGPYGAYSVRGDYKLGIYNEGKMLQTDSRQVNFSKAPNVFSTGMNLHRWDAGMNVTAGLELNCFITLGANYSMGLLDIDKSGSRIRNRYFGVSVGMLFDREDW